MHICHDRRLHWRATVIILAVLGLGGCAGTHNAAMPSSAGCSTVHNVEGMYHCAGECVITTPQGQKQLLAVEGEVDKIQAYPGSGNAIFQTSIRGEGGQFSETEIGVLNERILRTATSKVSDGQYPVLEAYVFDTDGSCRATGYNKIVRNPTRDNFKVCLVKCKKGR